MHTSPWKLLYRLHTTHSGASVGHWQAVVFIQLSCDSFRRDYCNLGSKMEVFDAHWQLASATFPPSSSPNAPDPGLLLAPHHSPACGNLKKKIPFISPPIGSVFVEGKYGSPVYYSGCSPFGQSLVSQNSPYASSAQTLPLSPADVESDAASPETE